MTAMTFGATCSPSSAQYIKNLNAEQFAGKFPRAAAAIIQSHYVDDLLDSVDTEEEAIQLAKDVKHIHSMAGFEIRNWMSNSRAVISAMEEKAKDEVSLNIGSESEIEKVLGMWWSTSTDIFTYKIKTNARNKDLLSGDRRPTKRELLRTLMTIFDPLGLLANFFIYVKIILQDVWRSGVDWDDNIGDAEFQKWLTWLKVLPSIEAVQIPRCYLKTTAFERSSEVELHTFVDASESSYAAVAYFRVVTEGKIDCALVAAKTRVAPLKQLSIPRMELQAAVLGTRLAGRILQEHSIRVNKRYFWTDSKNVLCWIRSDHRKYSQFVAFRVSEVLETTEIAEWKWIPSKSNVADEGTKWQPSPDFSNTSRWLNGPPFLREKKENWPKFEDPYLGAYASEEIKSNYSCHHAEIRTDDAHRQHVLNPEHYSEWKRLVRSTAWVIRYVHNLKAKATHTPLLMGSINKSDIVQAQNYLYRQAQQDIYSEEIAAIEANQQRIKKSSPLYKLSPYIDNNRVLRVKGRIDACKVLCEDDVKRPVILPRNHPITSLVIREMHTRYHHCHHETVINELRQKYHISRLRTALREEVRKCQQCKNQRTQPQPPMMGELPAARVAAYSRPFSYVGIDYFGPIIVAVGRRNEKRWGVLITCLTVRAVHIEVAHTLSADSCIMAIRNFIARRGTPIEIFSDQGTNFKGASKELNEMLQTTDHNKIAKEFTNVETKWTFIPPLSPHMGGSWERLVQSVKKVLAKISLPRNPTDEVLRNMLIEVEYVLNCRPLTYIPVTDDTCEAITPNHLLLGSSNGSKPPVPFNADVAQIRRNWLVSQQYADIFWKRWVQEYLPTLTKRTKWFELRDPIKVGDVVVIVDPGNPRNCWPKGKVIATSLATDGQVRWATVRTSHGIYERPAVKLAVLDVGAAEEAGRTKSGHTGGECQRKNI